MNDVIRRYKYLLSANISSSCCFTCFTCSETFFSCFSNYNSRAHIVERWKSVSVFYFDESYMRGLEVSLINFLRFYFFLSVDLPRKKIASCPNDSNRNNIYWAPAVEEGYNFVQMYKNNLDPFTARTINCSNCHLWY